VVLNSSDKRARCDLKVKKIAIDFDINIGHA